MRTVGIDPGPEIIPKEDYPKTLREFRAMKDSGMTNQQIVEKTGWDIAAVEALSDAADLSKLPVIQSIPTQPYPMDPPANQVETEAPPSSLTTNPSQVVPAIGGPDSGVPSAPVSPVQKADWRRPDAKATKRRPILSL